jgi:hypothetical protein
MPTCPISIAMLTIIVQLASIAGIVPVIGLAQPQADDVYSVIGAMLASVIVLVDYNGTPGTRRGIGHLIAVFIACAFCGSIGPGVILYNWFDEFALRLTWHGWAGAGFVFGLLGWVLTRSALWAFNTHVPGAVDDLIQRKLKRPSNRDDNDPS